MEAPRLIDTHCHLDAPEFDPDRAALIQVAQAGGVAGWILPAIEPAAFEAVQRCAANVPGGAYALGIHPMAVPRMGESDLMAVDAALQSSRDDPRCVAVGEIGLDAFDERALAVFSRQEAFFAAQLDIAAAKQWPVIVHSRRAVDKVLMHIRRSGVRGGCLHAFNGSIEQARRALDLGLVLGFGGAMTYDRALQIRRLAAYVPDDSFVLETDAPDIPPAWDRHGRTAPAALLQYAQTLSQLRKSDVDQVAMLSTRNALRIVPRMSEVLALSSTP